jgi:hypothetical protein
VKDNFSKQAADYYSNFARNIRKKCDYIVSFANNKSKEKLKNNFIDF